MKSNKLWSYLITSALAIALFFITASILGLFSATGYDKIIMIICDSFFIPGVILAGFGLLVVIANEGTFDMIFYGFKNLVMFLPIRMRKEKRERYYEYVERKKKLREENKRNMWFIFVVGMVFIAFAGICFLIDYIVK